MSLIQFVSVFVVILLQCRGLHANLTVLVTTMEDPPFVILSPRPMNDSSFENGGFDGYLADLLREIKKITKFNMTIHRSYANKFGEEIAAAGEQAGKWDGLIGEIVDKEADIAVGRLIVSVKRSAVVDFTQPFMESGVTFMIAKPKQLDRILPGPFDALRVVTLEIWVLTLFCLFVLVVSLMIIGRYYPYQKETFGLKDSIWFLMSSLMWQGYGKSPSAHGARFVAVFWWFFCAIFLMSYSAGLVHVFSLKLQSMPKLPALVPEDLLRQTALRYSPIRDSKLQNNFLSKSEIPVVQELWRAMRAFGSDSFPATMEEGVKKVRGGKFALFAYSDDLVYQANNDPECNLLVSEQTLDDAGFALAVRKDKPEVTKALSAAIVELKERGFTNMLYQKWFTKSCPRQLIQQHAEDRLEMQFQPINFLNFGGVFIVLVVGISIGLIISGIEIWLLRRRSQKEREERVAYGVEPQD